MSGMITDLSAIGSIDRTTDLLEIVDVSANASYKVTVNNLVGITGGSVVSTSDSQSLTNKTLDNTNILTIKATNLTIQDASDTTKQFEFVASSITTATTRSITIPDATGTLVLAAATQTLTNKTLTSPTITGGTIDNSTITVDSISGHTSATIVTIAALQINNGVVGSNGVATASLQDSAVTPAKLLAGTGTGWAWQSYTPTFANTTKGNGTVSGAYVQIGKTVHFRAQFNMGSTSAVSTAPTVTLPVTSVSYSVNSPIGYAIADDVNNTVAYPGALIWLSTTTAQPCNGSAGGTYVQQVGYTATIPFTWAVNDIIFAAGTYEAA